MHGNVARGYRALRAEHERVRAACMKVLAQELMNAGRRLASSAQLHRARPYLPFAPEPSSHVTAHPIAGSLPTTNVAHQEGLRRYPANHPTPQQLWVFIQPSKREGTQHFLDLVADGMLRHETDRIRLSNHGLIKPGFRRRAHGRQKLFQYPITASKARFQGFGNWARRSRKIPSLRQQEPAAELQIRLRTTQPFNPHQIAMVGTQQS
jgi:hypothetical protein